MAWQMTSATTPQGDALLQNQQQYEQAQRMMGQQAMAQQQQSALGQQALAQEQQAMAQRQQQFEAGLGHEAAMAQQQFQMASKLAEQEQGFKVAQDNALRAWSEQQTANLQKHDLMIQQLELQREQALASGMADVAERVAQQKIALKRAKAAKAQQLVLAQRMQGQTKEGIQRMLNGYESQLGRLADLAQREQDLGLRFSKSLVGNFDTESQEANVNQLKAFLARQTYRVSDAGPFSYVTEPSFKDLELQAHAGDAPGLEWLQLSPTSFGGLRGALDPRQTGDVSAMTGEMDAATMTKTLQERLSRGTLATLRTMGVKGYNEDAAKQLVDAAFAGKSAEELSALAQRANVPVSSLKVMLDSAARQYEANDSNERWARLRSLDAAAIEAAGGQKSLRREGLRMEMNAFKAKGKMLREAANRIPGMDLEEVKAGLGDLKTLKETGVFSDMIERSAERLGLGREARALRSKYAELPAAEEGLIRASTDTGDLAEQEAVYEAGVPSMVAGAQKKALDAQAEALRRLIEETGR